MEQNRILVVEDEEDILELVRYTLAKQGFDVRTVMTGEEALREIRSDPPDLVVLDLMLPGLDGLEVCKRVRAEVKTAEMPIVMLTARGEESDIILGLEMGADDYITKPFSPRVLLARVRSILRRQGAPAPPEDDAVIEIHNLLITPGRHEALVDGEPADLTATEFRILHHLAKRPGWVFTRNQIVDAVHGEGYPVTDRAVDVQIFGLRKKLGPASAHIETIRGVGYRFAEKGS